MDRIGDNWLIPLATFLIATVGVVSTVVLTTRKLGTEEVQALRGEIRAVRAEMTDVHRQLTDCRSENGDLMRRMFRLEDELAHYRTAMEADKA